MTASNDIFMRVRTLAFSAMDADDEKLSTREDLVPIERTVDGWICLDEAGTVRLLREDGALTCEEFAVGPTALLGSLMQRVPLASCSWPASPLLRYALDAQGEA